jgi:hypothetical protein
MLGGDLGVHTVGGAKSAIRSVVVGLQIDAVVVRFVAMLYTKEI